MQGAPTRSFCCSNSRVDLGICISNNVPGDAHAAVLGNHFENRYSWCLLDFWHCPSKTDLLWNIGL